MTRSNIVYNYECHCCQQCYVGSTTLQLFVRSSKHFGRSYRTLRPLSKPEKSSIREHCMDRDHPMRLENFSILDYGTTSDLKLLESLYIHKNSPSLNDHQSSVTLNITV